MKKTLSILTLSIASCFSAQADVRINGFANLVAGITTSSSDTLYGYNDSMSFTEESLFALQVSGDINSKMVATAQIVAQGKNDYDASFEWAYVTYKATDHLNVSGGRFVLPLFRYSSSIDVNYSYHWVTVPKSVYNAPADNLEGIKLDYTNYTGDWEFNLQAAYGTMNQTTNDLSFKATDLMIASGELTYDFFKIRGVYAIADANVEIFALNPVLASFQTTISTSLYDDLFGIASGDFMGIGIEVDKFNWFISSEIIEAGNKKDEGYARRSRAAYVTAGVRFGKFTPSITYELKETINDLKHAGKINQLVEPLQTALYGLQAATAIDNNAMTLSLRYDLDTNVALKTDLVNYTDELNDANDSSLFRFAINYVF